ncbi:unnamed protein product [Psylliodes chrysocephalus]|uniref:Uncharacterized protein n=1 Tax=Psylliodes chrysocephalus TaxID=3402493 RepID=A0A9P0CYN8_9CUCU|nr:unnamed protein product [Psylliodes chrysocephala]
MSEPSGPIRAEYETVYSKRLRERINSKKQPTLNVNVARKRTSSNSPKILKAKNHHPYKTVSTRENTVISTNLGSENKLRRDPLSKMFSKKSLEKTVEAPDESDSDKIAHQTNKDCPGAVSELAECTTSRNNQNESWYESLLKDEESMEKTPAASGYVGGTLKKTENLRAFSKSKEKDDLTSAEKPESSEKSVRYVKSMEKNDGTNKANKSSEKTISTDPKDHRAHLQSMEKDDSHNAEELDSSEKSDSVTTDGTESSPDSLEVSDGVIRSDSQESLEKLRRVLEDEGEESQSPNISNNTVLEMDDSENIDKIPTAVKKVSTFGKYGENFELYNSAYKTLEMPKNTQIRKFDFGPNAHTSGDDSTITPGISPDRGFEFGASNIFKDLQGTSKQDKSTQPVHNLTHGSADKNQAEGGSSSPRFGIALTASVSRSNTLKPPKSTGAVPKSTRTRIPSDPRIKIHAMTSDIPQSVAQTIFSTGNQTSEDDLNTAQGHKYRVSSSRNRSPSITPKSLKATRLQHPYKSVSTQGAKTNSTNLGSSDHPRGTPTQKFFSQKSSENGLEQMVTKVTTNNVPSEPPVAKSTTGSSTVHTDKTPSGKPKIPPTKKSLEKADVLKTSDTHAELESIENTVRLLAKIDEPNRKSSEKTTAKFESIENTDRLPAKIDEVNRKSLENTDLFDSKLTDLELESKENAAGHITDTVEPNKESWEKFNSGTYSDSTEPCDNSDNNTSDTSNESLDS